MTLVHDRLRVHLAGIVLAVALGAVAALVGANTGYRVQDVDEAVFRSTLISMRAGDGYYTAMRDALIEKEGAPPSSVRAVRPPTMFLFLRLFPASSWRWIVLVVYIGILLAAWHLALPHGARAAVVGCCLAFTWVVATAPYLFLHAELWGAPLFMAALLRLRQGDDATAAALLAGATIVRELFGLGLLLGLVVRRRRPWFVTTGVVTAAAAIHVLLARDILSAEGREAALGNEGISFTFALSTIAPGDGPVSWAFGVALLAFGLAALVHHRREDDAARLLLPFALLMVVLSIVATRSYWSITWGPALAAFVPGVFSLYRRWATASSERVAT